MEQNDVTNNVINKDGKQKSKFSVSFILIFLIVSVFLSSGFLLIILGDIVPSMGDIFSIQTESMDVELSDDDKIWSMNTEIEIFQVKHVNDEAIVSVISGSGDGVIAPGTSGNYVFYIKNLDKYAVDTKMEVIFEFTAGDHTFDNLPIEVRLIDYQGEHVSDGGWIFLDEYTKCVDDFTIGKNSYIYYELDWRWAFESGDDELDTFLGNLSSDKCVEFSIDIISSATPSDDPFAEGGLSLGPIAFDEDELDITPFIVLNGIILVVIAALCIVEYNIRKKKMNNKIK